MGKVAQKSAQGLLWMYKATVSPLLHAVGGGGCRFQPTCSEYAALALAAHGPMRGSWLALCRLLRCHPFSRGGFDPVPGTGYDPAPPRNVMHLP